MTDFLLMDKHTFMLHGMQNTICQMSGMFKNLVCMLQNKIMPTLSTATAENTMPLSHKAIEKIYVI